MAIKFFRIFFIFAFLSRLEGASPSVYVSDKVWEEVKEFIIPGEHPAKEKLDKIFLKTRAFSDFESMEQAGFERAAPQHHTHLIVTRHPTLKGYVIKAYLDIQKYHEGKPEYYFWIKRCQGSRLLKKSIKKHQFGHLLKVPKKWIYLLPDNPSALSAYKRKMFILIEEDMDIYDESENLRRWGSPSVSRELLKALFTVITEHGFHDCAKPANCPFSKDGRVALVDTQSFHRKKIAYKKLTPYLSSKQRAYWNKLIVKHKK